MRPLASLERFLERLFERPGSRLPGARPQPAVLARRLERTLDAERRRGADGLEAPTRLELRLRPEDLAAVAPGAAAADALEADLAATVLAHARRRRYGMRERPIVILVSDPALPPAGVEIRARFAGPSAPLGPVSIVPIEHTSIHPVPVVRASLLVREPGHPPRSVALDGAPLAVGRERDNDLVLGDARASRHHARIAARAGRLVLVDLGSTNGTLVNGKRVTEIALGEGDRITVGMTVLEVLPPVADVVTGSAGSDHAASPG